MASQDWFEKDFYAILGVPKDADDAAIKKAYRKLARKHHPDQNAGDTAAEQRFKDIGEANSVLSDPEKRREYDAVRQMARGGARFTAGGPGGGAGWLRRRVLVDVRRAGRRRGGTRVRYSTGGGEAARTSRTSWAACSAGGCRPGLRRHGFSCAPGAAQGRGPDRSHQPVVPRRGRGLHRHPGHHRRRADHHAHPGRASRTARRSGCAARASPVTRVLPRGDLILTVAVEKHPVFGREGNNLTLDLPVTFAEAALGATVSVPTLDGSSVKVRVAPGTPSGRVLRIKGRGVPHQGQARRPDGQGQHRCAPAAFRRGARRPSRRSSRSTRAPTREPSSSRTRGR